MEYSNARTSQQNGFAERKNRTLIEAARTMLADSFLPTTFWANAVNTACYVLNRVLVTKPQNKTPYKLLTHNQANKSTGLKEANNSAGIQSNDDQSANSEAIDLHEEHFVLPIWSAYSNIVKSSGDKIEKTIDDKTCEKPVSQVEQIFLEELEKLKRQEKEANDASRKETTHENQNAHTNNTNLLNAISTAISTAGPSRALNDGEPSYPDDPSMPHLKDIYASPSEGIFTDSPYDDAAVQIRSKVNKNSESHALHWKMKVGLMLCKRNCCSSKFRRQEEGIDYDEVFAPMARIESIRIFLAFASYMGFIVYQMDVKSAFLYGTIDEEVYVTQPHGFVDPKFPNKVKQKEDGIFISQDKYVVKILKKVDFLSVETASTPIKTQPDIMFVVYACSRFQEIHNRRLLVSCKELASPKQTTLGKDISNLFMAGSLPKTIWLSMHHVIAMKHWLFQSKWLLTNDMVKLRALIDGNMVVVSKDVIRQDLYLYDADGVECLPNEEIFTELARMSYEKPPPKLMFYKAFFFAQ
nr:retrovirus-related Pol polyprotein from transposon TNT 1-94 [Tanacetum cinerariifolium]